MSANIFLRLLRSVEDAKKTAQIHSSTSPLPIALNDGQAALQDQRQDCVTAPTISHFALLPFELCQAIIDNLRDDWAALRACSLTCKTFLHASRYHIFHSIRLDHGEDAIRFLHKVCSTDSTTGPYTYVRYLSLGRGETYYQGPQFANETLPLLATCLPNVTSLTLHCLNWAVPDDDAWARILSGFPKVQHLVLNAHFETSQQANEFISSFPLLKTLRFWDVSWKSYSEPVIPLPRSLKYISLHSTESHFFNRLLHLGSHPDVSTLYFERLYPKDAQAVGELLKTLGSRLKYLRLFEVEKGATLARAVCENLINLAHNTRLCWVDLVLSSAVWNNSSTLDWVSTLFSQITSNDMEYVWLQLPKTGADKLEVFLPSIEHVFTQQHWSNLRLFEIRIVGDRLRAAPKSINSYMPILDSRGVVLLANW